MENYDYSSIIERIEDIERAAQRLLGIFYIGDFDTLYISSAIMGDMHEISADDAEIITSALAALIGTMRETRAKLEIIQEV